MVFASMIRLIFQQHQMNQEVVVWEELVIEGGRKEGGLDLMELVRFENLWYEFDVGL